MPISTLRCNYRGLEFVIKKDTPLIMDCSDLAAADTRNGITNIKYTSNKKNLHGSKCGIFIHTSFNVLANKGIANSVWILKSALGSG